MHVSQNHTKTIVTEFGSLLFRVPHYLTYHTIPHVILTYVSYHTIPHGILTYSSLVHSILCPASDRCDTTGVSVTPSIRSTLTSVGSIPMGWWTILHLLASRVVESIAFSVPDRNVLWNREEDGLLVETVVKYSTNDVPRLHL